jgi:hypothetical protein
MRPRTSPEGAVLAERRDPSGGPFGSDRRERGFGPGFVVFLSATLLGSLPGAGCAGAAGDTGSPGAKQWYRGNTHAHTLWDNGDALPEVVADWYRQQGYQFVALSDHNERNALSQAERWIDVGGKETESVSPALLEDLGRKFGPAWAEVREKDGRRQLKLKTLAELDGAFGRDGQFLILPGEEIGDSFGGRLVHHNALNLDHILPPPGGGSVRAVMEGAIEAGEVESARIGKPVLVHLNHPNLGWAVGPEDLAAVQGERFFEVYSGNPVAHNHGEGNHPGTEECWDQVLAARLRARRGPLLYGLAADDAHHYSGKGPARPGRGWIMVRARELTGDALVQAMSAGDFYSSTGVCLEEIRAGECGLTVKVAPEPGANYTIRFVGTWAGKTEVGSVLQETRGIEATYAFDGGELYVRAVVISNRPHPDPVREGEVQKAWIQPVRVGWTAEP